ncbi:hypothetical protein KQI89_13965 [Clostridium sp. MSJ-4]|uniref:Uncharacterized protein n=1 Tax=Clostridium simiarum TaxID=2841506 RepID=A0ABS6F391_9CLOT|nr:hypothetical protein [Clostridium simiarum]MBU5592855.1 hypothetical protein [Clostridium simiarum]
MGKKKKDRYDRYREDNRMPQGSNNGFGGGMNPLMSMLGNMDMSQISSLLGVLNSDGANLGNLNIGDLLGSMNNQNNRPPIKQGREDISIDVGDQAIIQLLNSLKPFLGEREGLIDKVIDMYLAGDMDED